MRTCEVFGALSPQAQEVCQDLVSPRIAALSGAIAAAEEAMLSEDDEAGQGGMGE